MNVLNRISYNPLVIRTVRSLGLRSTFRRWYHQWTKPSNGTMPVRLGEFDCRFVARTPEQVRMLGKAQMGLWRQEVLEFLDAHLTPGDVVYDVGSNIGVFSVFSARKVTDQGQVIAFEPNPETCRFLEENIRLNSLPNLRAFQVALGEASGETELFAGDDLLFSSLVAARNGQTRAQSVRVVDGDGFCAEEGLPMPNLVMIDVEGYEYGAIKVLQQSLCEPACRNVVCEVHPALLPAGVNSEQLLDLLKSYGFGAIELRRTPGIQEFYAFASKS